MEEHVSNDNGIYDVCKMTLDAIELNMTFNKKDVLTFGSLGKGQLCVQSQIQDYSLRGGELDQYSFFLFVMEMYEEHMKRAMKCHRHPEPQNLLIVDIIAMDIVTTSKNILGI